MKLNGLEKIFKAENDEIIDFKQVDENGWSPLMYVLRYNKERNINLNKEHFYYLIKNSDFKQVNSYGRSILMLAFIRNKSENLNLSSEQFEYLIKNSDLKQADKDGWSPMMFALSNNKYQNLNLTNKQLKYLIENSDFSLITDKEQLIELKKIQSELLNEEILNKIKIKEENKKLNKI